LKSAKTKSVKKKVATVKKKAAGKSVKKSGKTLTAVKEAPKTVTVPSKKKKYSLEYVIKSSPAILYEFLSTPTLMTEWFADEVDSFRNEYSFTWDGETHKAKLVDSSDNEFIRFKWIDDEHHDEYFEFRISSTEITGDTVLTIIDFCEPQDLKSETMLWNSQVDELRQRSGAA